MFALCRVCAKAPWTPGPLGDAVSTNRVCHTQPFSCLGLWATGVCGGYRDGARVHRKPASNVRPSPPQAQNMDQPYPWLMSSGMPNM